MSTMQPLCIWIECRNQNKISLYKSQQLLNLKQKLFLQSLVLSAYSREAARF